MPKWTAADGLSEVRILLRADRFVVQGVEGKTGHDLEVCQLCFATPGEALVFGAWLHRGEKAAFERIRATWGRS